MPHSTRKLAPLVAVYVVLLESGQLTDADVGEGDEVVVLVVRVVGVVAVEEVVVSEVINLAPHILPLEMAALTDDFR